MVNRAMARSLADSMRRRLTERVKSIVTVSGDDHKLEGPSGRTFGRVVGGAFPEVKKHCE